MILLIEFYLFGSHTLHISSEWISKWLIVIKIKVVTPFVADDYHFRTYSTHIRATEKTCYQNWAYKRLRKTMDFFHTNALIWFRLFKSMQWHIFLLGEPCSDRLHVPRILLELNLKMNLKLPIETHFQVTSRSRFKNENKKMDKFWKIYIRNGATFH